MVGVVNTKLRMDSSEADAKLALTHLQGDNPQIVQSLRDIVNVQQAILDKFNKSRKAKLVYTVAVFVGCCCEAFITERTVPQLGVVIAILFISNLVIGILGF